MYQYIKNNISICISFAFAIYVYSLCISGIRFDFQNIGIRFPYKMRDGLRLFYIDSFLSWKLITRKSQSVKRLSKRFAENLKSALISVNRDTIYQASQVTWEISTEISRSGQFLYLHNFNHNLITTADVDARFAQVNDLGIHIIELSRLQLENDNKISPHPSFLSYILCSSLRCKRPRELTGAFRVWCCTAISMHRLRQGDR